MLYFIIYILFLHYIADFVMQTSWMALNKSKNNLALSVHVLTYTAVMLVGLHLVFVFQSMTWINVMAFCLVNAVLHFITDYITSRISSRFWANEQKRAYFWWVIGGDQWFHHVTLILLAAWLLQ